MAKKAIKEAFPNILTFSTHFTIKTSNILLCFHYYVPTFSFIITTSYYFYLSFFYLYLISSTFAKSNSTTSLTPVPTPTKTLSRPSPPRNNSFLYPTPILSSFRRDSLMTPTPTSSNFHCYSPPPTTNPSTKTCNTKRVQHPHKNFDSTPAGGTYLPRTVFSRSFSTQNALGKH